ncbi:SET domain containing protein [Trypanosoma brucei equiperdum]|uniref:SET domain containing protein n=1 Tax=Trypanosoma brucei equiperdum TaxID=630700 RepID=A0A3L6L5N7_9TRYP|nr:SET domain containing protein [Trypanosoma brucei equiperdum]
MAMKANFCFKIGEVICPIPTNYTFGNGELVLDDERRIVLGEEFNATIINNFLIATQEINKDEFVVVNPCLVIYDDAKLPQGSAVSTFKNAREDEQQRLFPYADEKVRQQALADGFIATCCQKSVEIVRKPDSGFATLATCSHEAGSIVFTSTALLLPFPAQGTIELPGKKYLRPSCCVEFVRHSCQPNVQLEISGTTISAVATRAIEKEEQLTRNFLCTEWDIAHPFSCACKTTSCYGIIRGFRHLGSEQQAQLLPSVCAAIKERHSAVVPPTASLAGLQKSTVLTLTSDGKIATQQFVPPGTVLLQVDRFDIRPHRVVIDSLSIAHSCDANTVLLDGRLVSLRMLQPGDQLSLNLSTLQYELPAPFECKCGSPKCSNTVRGFRGLSDEEKKQLLPFTQQPVFLEALQNGCPWSSSNSLAVTRRHPTMGEITYAGDFIPKGTQVFDLRGVVLPFATKHTIFVGDDEHLFLTDQARCIAHSCEPNLRVVMDRSTKSGYCLSLRDIKLDEMLTYDYLTTEWELASSFRCICGTANCYGLIRGFRYLDARAQLRLWPHAARGVKSMFSRQRRGVLASLDDSLISIHETSGELRLMCDTTSGVKLFNVTDVQVIGDEVALDDIRVKHSCFANAVLLGRSVVLRRASLRGEAVTININHLCYTTTPFKCNCKGEHCVGEVSGFKGLTDEMKNAELICASPHVREAAVLDGFLVKSSSPLVEVKADVQMGQSTFAKSDIKKGTRFFRVNGLTLPFPTMHTILLSNRRHLLFGGGAQCLAHSCDPNTRVLTDNTARTIECIALRDIRKGEVISFNYLTTEWDMQYPFMCVCGSQKCYGWIGGFKHLGNDARQKLWNVTSTAIKSLVADTQSNPKGAWIQIASKRLMVCDEGTVHVATEMVAGTVVIEYSAVEVLDNFVYIDGVRLKHHCSPTAALIEKRVVLLRTVSAGDELNVNLNCLSYSLPEEIECKCCRFAQPHKVRGFKWLDEQDKEALIVFAQPDVRAAAIRDGFTSRSDSQLIGLRSCTAGLEVIAKTRVAAGTRLLATKGRSLPFPTPLTLQLGERRHLLPSGGAQFVSHSCDPNTCIHVDALNEAIEFETIRDIAVGEVVTANFVTTEWELHSPFQCKCNSSSCLHNIRGFKFLSSAQRSMLQRYITPAMRRLAGLTASVRLPPVLDVNQSRMLYAVSPVARKTVLLECTNIDIQPVQVAVGENGYIIQHKEEGNTVLVEGRFLALRSIEAGELLTVNMNYFVYDMKPLFPRAYSQHCLGFCHMEEDTKQQNLYLCEPPVRAQAMRDGWTVKSTSPLIEIRQNGDMGQTAYASTFIKKGVVLFDVSGFVVPFPTMYTICVGESRHLLFGEGAECIAHHCDPNVQVEVNEQKARLRFVTLREISKGEMVTFNYCTTEWVMNSPFVCLCGSSYCAGTIRGFSSLCEADQQRLWPITSYVVKRQLARDGE